MDDGEKSNFLSGNKRFWYIFKIKIDKSSATII